MGLPYIRKECSGHFEQQTLANIQWVKTVTFRGQKCPSGNRAKSSSQISFGHYTFAAVETIVCQTLLLIFFQQHKWEGKETLEFFAFCFLSPSISKKWIHRSRDYLLTCVIHCVLLLRFWWSGKISSVENSHWLEILSSDLPVSIEQREREEQCSVVVVSLTIKTHFTWKYDYVGLRDEGKMLNPYESSRKEIQFWQRLLPVIVIRSFRNI